MATKAPSKAKATSKAKAPAGKSGTTKKKTTNSKKKVSLLDVQIRAQEIYQERLNSGRHGDHLSDWLEAEKALVR